MLRLCLAQTQRVLTVLSVHACFMMAFGRVEWSANYLALECCLSCLLFSLMKVLKWQFLYGLECQASVHALFLLQVKRHQVYFNTLRCCTELSLIASSALKPL